MKVVDVGIKGGDFFVFNLEKLHALEQGFVHDKGNNTYN